MSAWGCKWIERVSLRVRETLLSLSLSLFVRVEKSKSAFLVSCCCCCWCCQVQQVFVCETKSERKQAAPDDGDACLLLLLLHLSHFLVNQLKFATFFSHFAPRKLYLLPKIYQIQRETRIFLATFSALIFIQISISLVDCPTTTTSLINSNRAAPFACNSSVLTFATVKRPMQTKTKTNSTSITRFFGKRSAIFEKKRLKLCLLLSSFAKSGFCVFIQTTKKVLLRMIHFLPKQNYEQEIETSW